MYFLEEICTLRRRPVIAQLLTYAHITTRVKRPRDEIGFTTCTSAEIGIVIFQADGFEHLDADQLVELSALVAVVFQQQRDAVTRLAQSIE